MSLLNQTEYSGSLLAQGAISLKEAANLIVHTAVEGGRFPLVRGPTGTGKSQLLHMVGDMLPGYWRVYYDATTKVVGDDGMPKIETLENGRHVVRTAVHEDLGLFQTGPGVVMIDEMMKNKPILNSLMRLSLERMYGQQKYHPETRLFGTSNLSLENLGDMMLPHQRDRIVEIIVRPHTPEEWIFWGQSAGVHPVLLATVDEHPELLGFFGDYNDPAENRLIYDPRDKTRTKFATPRSIAGCTIALEKRHMIGQASMRAYLRGAVGYEAANLIESTLDLDDSITPYADIIADPMQAKTPTGKPGAMLLCVFTLAARVQQPEFSAAFQFLRRLPLEYQDLAITSMFRRKTARPWLFTRPELTDWLMRNAAMVKGLQ